MDRLALDALLCPPYATAALPHGASRGFTLASSYSMLFNATQLPAGVVPVTRVRDSETSRPPSRDRVLALAAEIDAKSVGLPVGVQVVGRAWKDHVVLALLLAIEGEVSRDPGFPETPVDPPR
jgi:fatty acid amide hydrolase